jgi:hypothetical protein
MPVTSLRKACVRPPEVAKIKIKIRSQIKSQIKSGGGVKLPLMLAWTRR